MPDLRHTHHSTTIATLVPLHATLGMPGLPQSGTGQTALLTGVNAARLIGKHFGPYPYSTLKPVIESKNIFRLLRESGNAVLYANAFPPQYFAYINSPKGHMTAIALSWITSGFSLNDSLQLKNGRALSADITGEEWNKRGFPPVPAISAQDAGKRLVELTNEFDFVFFEYFYTDHAGHSQSMEEAQKALTHIDEMLGGIIESMDHRSLLVVLTSDHGNIEDLSTKTHTRNPVPLLAIGAEHHQITAQCTNLTHVAPAIIQYFS